MNKFGKQAAVSYKVGQTVTYTTLSGASRQCKVEDRDADIKDGYPGFEGTEPKTGAPVWGYDSDVTAVA